MSLFIIFVSYSKVVQIINERIKDSFGNHHFSQKRAEVLLGSLRFSICLRVESRIEYKVHFFFENDSMGRASKLEVADLLSLCDHISHLNSCNTAGDLRHADVDDCDLTYMLIVCIDHHDFASSHCAEEGLTLIGRSLIVGDELGLIEIVCAWYLIDVLDDSIDRCVPTVVEEGTQEGLVNSSSLEQVDIMMFLEPGGSKHIAQRVYIVFQPKVIGPLDIFLRLHGKDQGNGLTGVDYDIVRVHSDGRAFSDGSESRLELSEEPLVPVSKSVMGFFREADELVIFYLLPSRTAEPAVGLFLVHEFQRQRGEQHLLIVIQDILKVLVNPRV